LGVAGIEPLAHMLGISARAVYSHVERLERAGLVWRVPIRDGGGGAVAISRTGARWVRDDELPAVAPRSQVPSTGEHSRAVSWVAAYFELQRGHRWLGPAELRADRDWQLRRDDGAGHLPDLGLITTAGERHAIEVELHSKSHDRLRAIFRAYQWKIDREGLAAVHYVTTRPVVARAVDRAGRDAATRRQARHGDAR
jgi:hypothetical protein